LPMNHLLGEDQVDAIIGAVQDLFN
jgi:hypothetical protein